MIRQIANYLKQTMGDSIQRWDSFWFMPCNTIGIGYVRVAIGVLAAAYAASWIGNLDQWISDKGRLNASVTRYLIGNNIEGTGSMSRMSWLYLVESKSSIVGYLVLTMILCIVMALGIGGRVVAAFAWILTLGIVHRVPMLQGAGDLLFTGIMGYLVIDTGKTDTWFKIGLDDRTSRWSARLALRLVQMHVVLWLMISFLGHLAEPIWWSGSAPWWLVSSRLSPWFSQFDLSDKPYLVNILSDTFLALHLLAIALLLRAKVVPLALLASLGMAMGVWLLAGDVLYSAALIACMSCFWATAAREISNVRGAR